MATYMGVEYCQNDAPWTMPPELCPFIAYNPATPVTMVASLYQMVLERILFRRLLNQIRLQPHQHCSDQTAPEVYFDLGIQVAMGQSLGAMVATAVAATETMPYQGLILAGAGNYGLGLPLFFSKRHIGTIQEFMMFHELPGHLESNPYHLFWSLSELGLSTANIAYHGNQRIHSETFQTHVLVILGAFDNMISVPMQEQLLRGLEVDFAGSEPEGLPDSKRILPGIINNGGIHSPCLSNNRKNPVTGHLFTIAALQFPRDEFLSGHHAAFQIDAARHQYTGFLHHISKSIAPIVGSPECLKSAQP